MKGMRVWVGIAALVTGLTARPVGADLVWVVQDTGIVGLGANLRLDANEKPHLTYCDGIRFALQYAKWTGTSWASETVDNTSNCGSGSSLALDSQGRPWISYCASVLGTSRLKLARWTGAAWDIEDVKTYVGSGTSLQLDSLDRPHIAYRYGNGPPQVEYAKYNGAEWEFEIVDPGADTHSGPRLVLDSQDRPHVGYSAYDPAYVKYATLNGSTWDIETVALCGDAGFHYLALNNSGKPRMLYGVPDGEPGEYIRKLMYAWRDGGTWETRDVRRVWGNIRGLLAMAAGDAPCVTYYAEYGYEPTYMTWNGTSWDSEVIEEDGGDPQAMVLDRWDCPHILYDDSAIKYAAGHAPLAVRWPR